MTMNVRDRRSAKRASKAIASREAEVAATRERNALGWYNQGSSSPQLKDANQLIATCPVTGRSRLMVSRDGALDKNMVRKDNPIRARGFDLIHNNEGYNMRVDRAKREDRNATNRAIAAHVKARG